MVGRTVVLRAEKPSRTRRPAYNPPVITSGPVATEDEAGINGIARLGFTAVCLYTFLLYSRAVEFIDTTGSLHLMILMGIPALTLSVISGGFFRGLASRIGVWLALFTGWLVLCLPFSIWRGGSVHQFTNGWVKSFITFVFIAGLIRSVRQLRRFAFVIAISLPVILMVVNLHSMRDSDDRLYVGWGTFGNANDLATVILMGLPFCAHVFTDKSRSILVRAPFVAVALGCLLSVLRTGSRGALLTIVLLGGFLFFKVPGKFKIVIAAAAILLAMAVPFVLTSDLKARYMTILQVGDSEQALSADNATAASAVRSTEARRGLLKHALELSVRHPLFGVGYGQFPVADANRAGASGEDAYWHEVHNIFVMVLVENGLPALILYGGVVFIAFRIAGRAWRATRNDPGQVEIARFSFTLLTSLTIFFICGNFATDAYGFWLPLLAGMASTLEFVAAKVLPQPVPFNAGFQAAQLNQRSPKPRRQLDQALPCVE